ncbi:MAG: PH domain-containing protein [Lachnospira sp.]
MSKYDNYYRNAYSDLPYDEERQLSIALMPGESVLWKGKSKKLSHVLNSIFSKMFPFAMLWLFFDMGFISMIIISGAVQEGLAFVVLFFAVHLLPVWMWLFGIIKALFKMDYDMYAITDKRILIKSESVLFTSIPFENILNVGIKRNFADKIVGVGDIYIEVYDTGTETILDVADYRPALEIIEEKVYGLRQAGYVPQGPNNNY